MSNTYQDLALKFKYEKCETSYRKLYEKMRPRLYSYIYGITKNSDATDDIISSTLTKVYLKIDQYDPTYQISTWAYRIAYNESLGWLHEQNKKISLNVFTDSAIDVTNDSNFYFNSTKLNDNLTYVVSSTEEELIEKDNLLQERYETLRSTIKNLPDLYRPYMIERFFNKRSYQEILDIMSKKERGISLQTVKNRIHGGRRLVRKELKDCDIFS